MGERTEHARRLSLIARIPSPSLVISLGLLLALLLVAAGSAWSGTHPPPDLSPYPWVFLRDGEPLQRDENVVQLIAVGDVMLGRGVTADPFDNVRSWLHPADLVLGNLESVIADETAVQAHNPDGPPAEFQLVAPPAAVAHLRAAGFHVLGLANNHALDLGAAGLERSASLLHAAGIATVGAGPDPEAALQPLRHELNGVQLAILAFNAVPAPAPEALSPGWVPAPWDHQRAVDAVSAARDLADAVLVSVHWGYEYHTVVDPAQRHAADALLNAGADLVVGHHPHVAQPLDIGPAGVVAYSLGNFVFDQHHGETGRGLALRAFFDDHGLRALQALPIAAGPRPRLMASKDAVSLLTRVAPPPRRLHFACDTGTCRQLQTPPPTTADPGSTLFWGGAIDLTGDGHPEHVRRVDDQIIIYERGVEVWRSPSGWRVVDAALGDPTDDGRHELVLALWKDGLDGLEPPDPEKENALRSRPFIIGYRGGIYRTLWGGSAVTHPIQEIELGDVDGDGVEEFIVLEDHGDRQRAVSVWCWHGWGFTLMWRSPPGLYRDLMVGDDGSISVVVD